MININELMSVIVRIRNSADGIVTAGRDNRERIDFIYNACNELLKQLDEIREKAQKEQEAQEVREQAGQEIIRLEEVK